MNYGNMISRSLSIAFKYRSLWVFGLFIEGFGGALNLDTDKLIKIDSNWGGHFGGFDDLPISFGEHWVGLFLLAMIALGLLWAIAYHFCMPAMIDGVNKITRGGVYRFGESFSRGLDFFLRFLGLTIITLFIILVSIAVVVILAIVLTPFSLILTLPVLLLLIFVTYHIFGLAEVAMVARDCPLIDALAEGAELFKKHIGECIIMTLLLIALGLGLFVIVAVVALIAFAPIGLLVAAITENFAAVIILGLILGLPISLVIGGFSGTFFTSFYVQFYFGLVEPGGRRHDAVTDSTRPSSGGPYPQPGGSQPQPGGSQPPFDGTPPPRTDAGPAPGWSRPPADTSTPPREDPEPPSDSSPEPPSGPPKPPDTPSF